MLRWSCLFLFLAVFDNLVVGAVLVLRSIFRLFTGSVVNSVDRRRRRGLYHFFGRAHKCKGHLAGRCWRVRYLHAKSAIPSTPPCQGAFAMCLCPTMIGYWSSTLTKSVRAYARRRCGCGSAASMGRPVASLSQIFRLRLHSKLWDSLQMNK